MRIVVAAVVAVAVLGATARAQPEPSGPHPRIVLDDQIRATWKRQVKDQDGAIPRAIARCVKVKADPKENRYSGYQGAEWATSVQACLIAWAATGDDVHAATAMTYFVALIDDLDEVGDGKGGDLAARRDHGFAIRFLGAPSALAYDWLHDHKLMTPAIRARARQRFTAWTDWYPEGGYRPRDPGTNYHAGWLAAATLISVAEAGDGGADSARLWRLVADELWAKDMVTALGPDGVLEGGDWAEGWQYGPFATASIALSARVAAAHGIKVPGIGPWLEAVLKRHVYALSATDRTLALGDTEDELPSLAPSMLPLAAVVVGDAPAAAKQQAEGEIARLKLDAKEFPLFDALVAASTLPAVQVPRASWPTAYMASGTGVLYARTSWATDAVWIAISCNRTPPVDHNHPDAGNLVITRGKDELLVDPSPYGSLSSLTSNAPTVESAQLPDEYKPSQAFWSTSTGYGFATQTASGALAVRCDYADAYKFQERKSDVPRAQRDIVLLPRNNGTDATVLVIDRAASGAAERGLHLRFRTTGTLVRSPDGAGARAAVGQSILTIRQLAASGGTPELRHLTKSDCWQPGITRGNCDVPRFAVEEWRTVVPGPEMLVVHSLEVAGKPSKLAPTEVVTDGVHVVSVEGGAQLVVFTDNAAATLAYKAPRAPVGATREHVILDAPVADDGTVAVTAAVAGDACAVTLTTADAPGATRIAGRPGSLILDDRCALRDGAPRQPTPHTAAPAVPHATRGGCCDASTGAASSTVMTILVMLGLNSARPRKARVP
jgi:hypothetical protein